MRKYAETYYDFLKESWNTDVLVGTSWNQALHDGVFVSSEVSSEVSTLEVKNILQQIIDGEDKRNPYSDDTLTELLKNKGYNIARRTVAKYRELLNVPVARLRKEL